MTDSLLTAAFLRRLRDLDKAGLEAMRKDLVGRQEVARMRFSRTRSVRDGESYRRRGHELMEVRARLRRLDVGQQNDPQPEEPQTTE